MPPAPPTAQQYSSGTTPNAPPTLLRFHRITTLMQSMQESDTSVAGLILIGGASQRMGSAKALVKLDGIPLWNWVTQALAPLVSATFLLGAIDHFSAPEGFHQITDDPAGAGPLGGLVAGLEGSGYTHHLLVAVDYPLIRRVVLERFAATIGICNAACARIDGRIEPLIGYYHKSCAPAIRELLKSGDLRSHMVIERVSGMIIPESEILKIDPAKVSYFNVNRPSDLDAAETLLRSITSQ